MATSQASDLSPRPPLQGGSHTNVQINCLTFKNPLKLLAKFIVTNFQSVGNERSEALSLQGRAGREVDYYYEKRNLENGDSTDYLSSHRSSNHAWCYKLHSALDANV